MRSLLLALLCLLPFTAHAAPSLESLEETEPAGSAECGLFLGNAAGKLVFFADTHFTGFVKVQGLLVALDHVKTTNHQRQTGLTRRGDRYQSVFATLGHEVRLDLTVTKGCEASVDRCEGVDVKGTLQLQQAGGVTRLKVSGSERCPLEE